ncbi:uncharacterized protein LOC110245741 [Exaiptasia diaphana]|uniref:Uncharacterized protein n=1 Tax=Exaiptasia diaphana TaxID=2652724 RepID=A0A913XQK9_EXADI|nr:uncharacterized protein LOC110245741 [Exaiptasia diaphana]KXJ10235.1 hypothetical protein AC249_AIPGENE29133 [Exaiptasia diaphana]
MNYSYSKRKMNASIATSSDILDKKWHKITYEKHKKRLEEIKGTVRDQNRLRYNYEEVQLQMRIRRAIAEERRQAIIDQENRKLLERLVQITTNQRSHFPEPWTRKKKTEKGKKKEEKQRKKKEAATKVEELPPIK